MARYINDDAPITAGIRTADKLAPDQLKQIMITKYNNTNAATNHPFNQNNYNSENQALEDLMAVLSYEDAQILKDLSNIDFNRENLNISDQNMQWYEGDIGTNLCGINTLPNGLCYCGAIAGGDWEQPLFFIIYHDKTQNALRAYIPIRGNIVNCDTLSAFGSETNLCNPNLPYNLVQLYNIYKTRNLLTPNTTPLSEFMEDDTIIGNSYLQQYGGLHLTGKVPGQTSSPNAAGFNWDAIGDELMTTIKVV